MNEMQETDHRDPIANADMEQVFSDASLSANVITPFTTRVHVRALHYRRRDTDPDGVSCKAVLDAIVNAGILTDDSSKQIASFCTEVIKTRSEEKTIIEITPIIGEEDDQ